MKRRVDGICECCTRRAKVRARSFWTTGLQMKMCRDCEKALRQDLNDLRKDEA